MKLVDTDKKPQNYVTRFLMVDNQQITFNNITEMLEKQLSGVQGKLLDDLASFEKLLNLQWDVIIFHAAYDFNHEQALEVLKNKGKQTPIILLSNINPKSGEGLKTFQLGIYDIVSSLNLDYLSLTFKRASQLSRLIHREHQLSSEINQLQQQTQTLVEHSEHAIAVFQEGVHISNNEQYAHLFGASNIEEFIGLPILETLHPENLQDFKHFFKRLSKGDFSQSALTIECLNPDAQNKQLPLQFSPTEFEGEPALQLVIALDHHHSTTEAAPTQQAAFANLDDIYHQLNFTFAQSNKVALALCSITHLPDQLLQRDWSSCRSYFNTFENTLSSLTSKNSVLRIAEQVFLIATPVDDTAEFQQKLKQFASNLPAELTIHEQSYPLNSRLSVALLDSLPPLEQLGTTLQQIFNKVYDPNAEFNDLTISDSNAFSFGEMVDQSSASPSSLALDTTTDGSQQALAEQVDTNRIQLSFQQLYDKEDIDTHIYEVTSSFTHNNQVIDIESYGGLQANPELALKVDRWVLVEASKRLHQFLSQCPKARIIINLHIASLHDNNLIPLLSKLVNLINSKYNRPLILQFKEEDVLTNLEMAVKFTQAVQELNMGITIRDFGQSAYCINILQKLKFMFAKLSPEFSHKLSSDDGLVELQETLDSYKEHSADARFLISGLNDMTLFANAWNVDVRYLQGNYFQAKQEQFVNSAN